MISLNILGWGAILLNGNNLSLTPGWRKKTGASQVKIKQSCYSKSESKMISTLSFSYMQPQPHPLSSQTYLHKDSYLLTRRQLANQSHPYLHYPHPVPLILSIIYQACALTLNTHPDNTGRVRLPR